MDLDFATIGKQVKAKSGAYADLPDETIGQLYMKKTNPLQYELILQNLTKTQGQELSFQGQGLEEQDLAKKAQALIAGGYSPENIPTNDLQVQAALEMVSKGGVYKPVSASAEKRKLILEQGAPVLQRISESAEKADPGVKGWLKAFFGQVPGVEGGEAEFLKRQNEGFARLIAGAFAAEAGVATDRDVARWQKLLPQPGDTQNERKRMLKDIVTQIRTESEALGFEPPASIIEMLNSAYLGGKGTQTPIAPALQPVLQPQKSKFTIEKVE